MAVVSLVLPNKEVELRGIIEAMMNLETCSSFL